MTWEEFKEYMNDNEVEIVLEGGGDSGWTDVMCDDVKVRIILEQITDNNYDYGRFAGNFSVRIIGKWNKETECIDFEGYEDDDETEHNILQHRVFLEVKPELSKCIDSVSVYHHISDGDVQETKIRVNIKNGIWQEEFTEIEESLKEVLENINFGPENDKSYTDEVILLKDGNIDFEIESYCYRSVDKSKTVDSEEIMQYLTKEVESE